jgi:protoporphyrin/coproporphyrin ferrochelatase
MSQKIAVALLNMGGPTRQEEVRPFLYNLFSDRQLIRLGPEILQKPLAALISWRRAGKSRANYQKIGGGSPLGKITAQQALALEQALAADGDFMVQPVMRYWHPFAAEVLPIFSAAGATAIIALPLYPHLCRATSGSSLQDLCEQNQKLGFKFPIHEIPSWPAEPEYIASLVARIQAGLALFGKKEAVELVYSAHSLPQRFIDEGDPYVEQLKATIAAVEAQIHKSGTLCFQSRSGPVQWLEPATPDMLQHLARAGSRNILMVPLAFVSDHIETLYEINMLYKDMAQDLGMRLETTLGLNTEPQFIQALRSLVLRHLPA